MGFGRLVLMVHTVDPLKLQFSPIYLPTNQYNDEKKIKIYIVLHISQKMTQEILYLQTSSIFLSNSRYYPDDPRMTIVPILIPSPLVSQSVTFINPSTDPDPILIKSPQFIWYNYHKGHSQLPISPILLIPDYSLVPSTFGYVC